MQKVGWFIVSDTQVLGIRHGREGLLRRTKRGVPSGSLKFNTQAQAQTEIGILISGGHWPLFMPYARAERIKL